MKGRPGRRRANGPWGASGPLRGLWPAVGPVWGRSAAGACVPADERGGREQVFLFAHTNEFVGPRNPAPGPAPACWGANQCRRDHEGGQKKGGGPTGPGALAGLFRPAAPGPRPCLGPLTAAAAAFFPFKALRGGCPACRAPRSWVCMLLAKPRCLPAPCAGRGSFCSAVSAACSGVQLVALRVA